MQWVSIQLKGTGRWRIARVEEGWSKDDWTETAPPKKDELFDTEAAADAECEKRNYPPGSDDDSI